MAQVTDEQLIATLDPEANSIAIIVKHMAGNMRSRWTDFLTSDGEKTDRHRDTEFEDAPATRQALMELWQAGWQLVFGALEPLIDADLTRQVTIRGEPHSVMQAINRQIAHYAQHVGQIVAAGQTLSARQMAIPEHPPREVRGIQEARAGGRSQPALIRSRPVNRLRRPRRGKGRALACGIQRSSLWRHAHVARERTYVGQAGRT